MADSTFDCYLCGTANPASADYCVRCSGQLLKVADASPQDEDSESSGDLPSSFDNPFGSDADQQPSTPQKPSRKVHASIEDQRLSDALGLSEDIDTPPDTPEPTMVAGAAAGTVPQIPGLQSQTVTDPAQPNGAAVVKPVQVTRPDADPRGNVFTSRGDEEVGPIAWVIVAMLFMTVGWFGYSTIFGESDRLTPESIGFVAETTTLPPTTTTTPPEDVSATASEVESDYDSSLVRLVPFQCEAGNGEQSGEPVVGVAINRRSVLVGPGLPAGTNAIRIVTRSGATRVAILSQQAGATIATSNAQTSRNLDIAEIGTETSFYMHYNLEENEVFVTEASQDVDVELEVSDVGAVHQVRLGQLTVSAEQLAAIDLTVAIDEEVAARGQGTCAVAARYLFETAQAPAAEDTENE